VKLLSLVEVLQKIEQNAEALSKELERIGVESLALLIRDTVKKLRIVKRISFSTYTMFRIFKELANDIEEISRHAVEDPTTILENLKRFITSLTDALSIIWRRYEKTKILILIMETIYIMITINTLEYYIPNNIAFIAKSILLALGLIFIITLTLGLTSSLFLILSIPSVPIVASMISLEQSDYLKLIALTTHIVALALSTYFVSKSIWIYVNVKRSLVKIAIAVENVAKILKSLEIRTKPSIDISIYTDVYGDKIFELIKYLEDMQKLRE
jgi:hypothetical protein